MTIRQHAIGLLVAQVLLTDHIVALHAMGAGVHAMQGSVDTLVLVNKQLSVALSDPAAAGLIAGRG